jgi:hypothetical protein
MTTPSKRLAVRSSTIPLPLPLAAASAALVISVLFRKAIAPHVIGSSFLAAVAVVGVATALRRTWPTEQRASAGRQLKSSWKGVFHIRGLFCEIVPVGQGTVRTRFRNGRTEPIWIGWHFLDESKVRGARLEPGETHDALAMSESMLVSIWECKDPDRRAAAERKD